MTVTSESTEAHELALKIQRAWDAEFPMPMDTGDRGLDYRMALSAANLIVQAGATEVVGR